ncbi:hypothetical protein OSTOST_10516, partial [Ostertagia ostertagi]
MNLRAFVSNSSAITKAITSEDQSSNSSPKVLGLRWDSKTDEFSIDVKTDDHEESEPIETFVAASSTGLETSHKPKDLVDLSRYSSKTKVLRIIAYVIKFVRRTTERLQVSIRNKLQPYLRYTHSRGQGNHLTAADIQDAHCALIKNHQAVHLHQQNKKELFKNLNLRKGKDLLIRAYGRINKRSVNHLVPLEIQGNSGKFNSDSSERTRGASAEEFSSHVWWKAYSLRSISENGISTSFFTIKVKTDDHEESEPIETFVAASSTGLETSHKPKDLVDLSRYSSKTKVLRIIAYVIKFVRRTTERLQVSIRNKLQPYLRYTHSRGQGNHLTAADIQDAHCALIKNHQAVHLHQQNKKELFKNLNLRKGKDLLIRAYGRIN